MQELGWDSDADDDVRMMIEDAIDGELVEEAMEAVDVVLLWWRDDDGDLVDSLVDALTDLTDTGYIWLMTPKVGREGYVDAADLAEAAVTAGLALTNSAARVTALDGDQAGAAAGRPAVTSRRRSGWSAGRPRTSPPATSTASWSARPGLRGAPAVLIFYPWAFSSICRAELAAVRDDHDRFTAAGARVLAVSCDAMFTLRAYADTEQIGFDLLSDHWPHGAIARAYGVFDERGGVRAARLVRARCRRDRHLAGGQRDRRAARPGRRCWKR